LTEVLSVEVCEQLCDALPRAATVDAALGHIESARRALLGPGLLTVNLNATAPDDPPDEVQLQRLWSSDPQAYPVAGRKRKTLTRWTQHLLLRAEVFVGEGEAALAEVFDDHALIATLGLRAVVNVPLLEDGRCAATFNVLGTRARWPPLLFGVGGVRAGVAPRWVRRARREARAPPPEPGSRPPPPSRKS
jgi:hypothetical protein